MSLTAARMLKATIEEFRRIGVSPVDTNSA